MSDAEGSIVARSQLRNRKLRHGFKAAAKRRSLELRRAHGLRDTDPLNCYSLTEQLGIEIVRLSDLPESNHKRHLTEVAPGVMSAATVKCRGKFAIWINDTHSRPRQMLSIAHELGHIALQHADAPVLNANGCREHDADVEAEADYFGSVLLVTDQIAIDVVASAVPIPTAVERYGVSRELLQWRVNDSGAQKRVQRARAMTRSAM